MCRGFTSRNFIGPAVVSRLHSHDRTDRHGCGLIIMSVIICGHEKGRVWFYLINLELDLMLSSVDPKKKSLAEN